MIVPGNTIKLVDIGTSNAVVPAAQSQSPVVKAVKNIKKKNAGAYIRLQPTSSQTDKTNTQNESGNAASGRGVVYLSHIPDGFYEEEMRQYFSQFGRVTRVKLARSKKTGRSRGYAFIEFQYAEVAKVVAETMNNYLLYNRLLKATYMDKEYPAAFWNQQSSGPQNCPLARNRKIEIKRKNAVLNPAKELARQSKRRRQLAKTLTRLKDAGVDYTLQVKDEPEQPAGAVKTEQKISNANNEQTTNVHPVLLVDESDDEIEFNVPSFVIRKTLKRRSNSPPVQPSPKAKRGKQVKSEILTPEVTPPIQENLTSPKDQNTEASSGSRKSGRISVIPKHISSGFQVTISPAKSKQKKSLGKETNMTQTPVKCEESSEQLSTPEAVSPASPRFPKSVESSTNKKSKNLKLSAVKNNEQSPESIGMTPRVRRKSAKAAEISDSVITSPVEDGVGRKPSPKADGTGLTPKQVKNDTPANDKRKTPKVAPIPESDENKTVVLRSIGKTPISKTTPENQDTPVQKPTSGDKKVEMHKTPSKTPMGRKSFPLSKQSGLMQKPVSEDTKRVGSKTPSKTSVGRKSQNWTNASGSKLSPVSHGTASAKLSSSGDKKRMGPKTPLKTPVGRKSQKFTAASSPKHSPLSHSTALKQPKSVSPKVLKPARKSLKLNN